MHTQRNLIRILFNFKEQYQHDWSRQEVKDWAREEPRGIARLSSVLISRVSQSRRGGMKRISGLLRIAVKTSYSLLRLILHYVIFCYLLCGNKNLNLNLRGDSWYPQVFLQNVIRDTVTYTEHAKRKTVTAMDVVYALKRQGRTLYAFGG